MEKKLDTIARNRLVTVTRLKRCVEILLGIQNAFTNTTPETSRYSLADKRTIVNGLPHLSDQYVHQMYDEFERNIVIGARYCKDESVIAGLCKVFLLASHLPYTILRNGKLHIMRDDFGAIYRNEIYKDLGIRFDFISELAEKTQARLTKVYLWPSMDVDTVDGKDEAGRTIKINKGILNSELRVAFLNGLIEEFSKQEYITDYTKDDARRELWMQEQSGTDITH